MSLPKLMRTLSHDHICCISINHFFLAFDLFSIDNCAYFCRKVLDCELRSAGRIMDLPRFDLVHSDGQMLSGDCIV